MQSESNEVFLAPSIFICRGAHAISHALRMNLARIVILSAILLLSLLIGGLSLRRTHFS
jgi:hypothetical protein